MTDLSQFHFRTAVGGFHKGDVTEYIAKAAQNHSLEKDALEKRIRELEEDVRLLRQQLLEATLAASEPAPVESSPVVETKMEVSALELEAYRRAEAVERTANHRARQVYTQLEGICKTADEDFEAAKTVVAETAQLILNQAMVLDQACVLLRGKLSAAQEDLRTADAMVPDPGEAL